MRDVLSSGTAVEVVRPVGGGGSPVGVVVAPDIFGLRPLFDGIVQRLAGEHGFAVAAVEPFPGREQLTIEERMAAMPGLVDAERVGDLVAAADLLGCDRTGIVGFCMGGMLAMKAVAAGRFDAAVPFYGMIRNPEAWRSATNGDALDALLAAPGSAAKVLAVVGTADPYTPADDVDALEAAGATVLRYEGAEHGFVHDPARPAHRAQDAADAWAQAIPWLSGP